jgi:hypothetical protein
MGPHLPLNVDVVIPTSLAKMVSEELGAMVLPPIAYGYKSHPTAAAGIDIAYKVWYNILYSDLLFYPMNTPSARFFTLHWLLMITCAL